jgi:membrane fusion protein, copper/silver efflux system
MSLSVKTLSRPVKVFLFLALTATACRKPQESPGHAAHAQMTEAHQKIQGDTLHLSAAQEELSALALDTVALKTLNERDNLLGTAAVDEEKITLVSARVKGRLQRLFVRNPGAIVRKGQAAYQIYSEELLAQVREYQLALREAASPTVNPQVSQQLLAGARRKLLRWGLTEPQLREIARQDNPTPYFTFYSPTTGYLADLAVREGQYVEPGTGLFKLADLRSLWIETQHYANEVRNQDRRPQVSLHFEAYPTQNYTGHLVYDNPSLEENQKISLVRYRIANPDLKIKPGMMAYVHREQAGKATVVIPKTALVEGAMTFIWVKTGAGMFERRMIKKGLENKREVEALSGIQAGEVVVSSGGYLLSGELTLRQGGLKGHAHAD